MQLIGIEHGGTIRLNWMQLGGDTFDGVLSTGRYIPDDIYYLYIRLEDKAGNSRSYSSPQLHYPNTERLPEKLDVPVTVINNSEGDILPPILDSIILEKTRVNAGETIDIIDVN